MGLSAELNKALSAMQYQTPTPVQEASVGPMMEKQDILVQAPTGTGKTCAFGIPIIESIDAGSAKLQSVILCPTRELALQTARVLGQLTRFKHGIRVQCVYGGEPIGRQITALRRRPQIIVATPGRLMDHIRRRTVRMGEVRTVVLDEADRMLDMGFRDDMAFILQHTPDSRQTVLFSATLSREIQDIAGTYQTTPRQIVIAQKTLTVDRVEQYYSEIRGKAKLPALLQLLGGQEFALSLVFVATKAMADSLARELSENGYRADALHGDLQQRQRDAVMSRYRSGKLNVLVATDVAARGIDVNDIDVVVNYDIPGDCESYIHRIGRTGRANRNGLAYTFIYPRERAKLQGIIQKTKAPILPFSLLQTRTPELHVEPDRKRGTNSTHRQWSNKKRRPYAKSRVPAGA